MTRSTTFSILDFLSIHSAFPYTRLHALSSLYCILYLPSFVFIVNSCLMVFNLYVSIYFMLFFLAYNFSLRQFHQQYAVATVSSIVTTVRSLNNGGAVVSFVWNFFSCVYNFCSFVGPEKCIKKIRQNTSEQIVVWLKFEK